MPVQHVKHTQLTWHTKLWFSTMPTYSFLFSASSPADAVPHATVRPNTPPKRLAVKIGARTIIKVPFIQQLFSHPWLLYLQLYYPVCPCSLKYHRLVMWLAGCNHFQITFTMWQYCGYNLVKHDRDISQFTIINIVKYCIWSGHGHA